MFHISIGAVVKAWRQARQLTVTDLAARAGRPITKGYLSQLEHDKIRQPGDEHLTRLARALDIPVTYLLTRRLPDKEQSPPVLGAGAQSPLPDTSDHEEELLKRMLVLVDELAGLLRTLLIDREKRQREEPL